eukprot:scaffold27102_cov57-Phaeocystis_antarctica.AAC.6
MFLEGRYACSSLASVPLWSAGRALLLLDDDDLVLLLDDVFLLEVRAWRHGRGRALLLDKCAGRHGRDCALLLEAGAGRHSRERALALSRRRPSRRRLPLRRSRDAQRRLLGGGEVAQVHVLASTALHPRLTGLELAGIGEAHPDVASLALGHEQRQSLRLRLLPRLLARQRRRRCSP